MNYLINIAASLVPAHVAKEQPVAEEIKEPKNPLSSFKPNKNEIIESIVTCKGIKQIQSAKGIGAAPIAAAPAAHDPIAAWHFNILYFKSTY